MTQDKDPKAQGNQPANGSDQGGPPAATKAPSPGKPAVTVYLQEDLDKAIAAATGDFQKRLTEQGREIASMKTTLKLVPFANAELEQLRQQNATLQAQVDDEEERGARKDPDLQALAKERRDYRARDANLRLREQTLGLRELEFEADSQELGNYRRFFALHRIAGEHGVSAEALANLNPENEDQMTVFAQTLAKAGGGAPSATPPTTPVAKPLFESGVGTGGGIDLGSMTAFQKIQEGLRREEAQK